MGSPVDFSTRRDRAEEATSLLGHRIYGEAIGQLRQNYLDTIAALPIGSDKLPIVHAKIKVLEEVDGELRSIVATFRLTKRPE